MGVPARGHTPAQPPTLIPWWILAAAFYVAEAKVVHIHIGHSAHSFSMSEVPLVIGLFLVNPTGFIVARVVGFVEAPAIGLDLPLDLRGTAFQQRVWQALREIPVGQTASYAEIAQRIGSPKAVRGVAQACAANAVAVAIPCHRVVRSDGALSGYRWGVERKRALLERENAA